MQRRTRVSVLGIVAAGVLVGLAGPGVVAPTASPPAYVPDATSALAVSAALQTAPAGESEAGPTALTRHLEELRQATPGGQVALEGPGTAEEQAFAIRAYPADSITQAQAQRAQESFASARSRASERSFAAADAAAASRWRPYGPSRALYPFTKFRNYSNYVPNKYVAGGRTTSLTLAPTCKPGNCRLWITPAGGGIWRTEDATVNDPTWKYLGGPLAINSSGTVALDPNDRSGNTLYLGTGEANTCASGCVAGAGLYRSTNGGDTWTGPLGRKPLGGKGVGEIIVRPGDPKTIYAATTTALRGMSSACCDGVTRPVPDAEKWGLYKSTDRGRTWRFIHNGSANPASCTGSQTEFANSSDCSPRGVRHLVLDPQDADTVYASSYARGVWRSTNAGRTWTQVKPSINAALVTSRAAIAVTELADGRTRMYVHEGNAGTPYSRLFRSDDVARGAPAFQDLSSPDPAQPGFATYNQCGAQCWYDLFVYTPEGKPDIVYTGGSYAYGETAGISNGRAVVLSTDAGRTGTDMTMDSTDDIHPNALHPDQHDLVTLPGKPFTFIEANDGGLMRSSGRFASMAQDCAKRGLKDAQLTRCEQLLSRIPTKLEDLNEGLNTLQFTHLAVSPHDQDALIGGTQDNGTWQTGGNTTTWRNKMIGDGGFAGFDVEREDFRFHTFTGASPEVNFDGGDIGEWIYTAAGIANIPGTLFYTPVISDPQVSGTMYAATAQGVHRTKTFGLGDRTIEEAKRICNAWTGTFEAACGDYEPLGVTGLTAVGWGTRNGGAVSALERPEANRNTLWAGTGTGRLFVSRNTQAVPASDVRFTRVDLPSTPGRFISGITSDPEDANHVWVSYSGYDTTTPGTPGHVFEVRFDPATGTATWTNRSNGLADLPITDVARDPQSGALYASSDFGVMRLASARGRWEEAAPGMPNVEVAGLTVSPQGGALYAATHGLGAYRLDLG